MNRILFFTLWRAALIAMLGLVLHQLYSWSPAPLLILAIVCIAVDSIATMWALKRMKE